MKGNQLMISGIIQEALSAARADMLGLTYKSVSASRARALIAVAKAIAQTGDMNTTIQTVTEALSLPDWKDYVAIDDVLGSAAEIAEKTQSVEIIKESLDSQKRLHDSTRDFIQFRSVLLLIGSLIKIGENKKDIGIVQEALKRAREITRDLPRVEALAMVAKSLATFGLEKEANELFNEALEEASDEKFDECATTSWDGLFLKQTEAVGFISERMWEIGEQEKAKKALRTIFKKVQKMYSKSQRGVSLSCLALSMARIGLIPDAKEAIVAAIYAACRTLGGEPDMDTVRYLKEAFSIIGPSETFSNLGPKEVFGDATATAPEVACDIANIANGFEHSTDQIQALSIYAELLVDFGQLKEVEKILNSALYHSQELGMGSATAEDRVFESMARIIEKSSGQKVAENFVKKVQKLRVRRDKVFTVDPRPSALLVLAPAIARAGERIASKRMVIYALKLAKGIRHEYFREQTLSQVTQVIAELGGKISAYDLIREVYSVAKKIKYNKEKAIALSSVAEALATLKQKVAPSSL